MSLEIAVMKMAENLGRIADAMEGKAGAKAGKPATEAEPPPATQPTRAPATQPTRAKPAAESAGIDYVKDVKPKALELANSNRPALLAIYKKFGVSVGTELKPNQYADALRMIEAELAGGEEDEVA